MKINFKKDETLFKEEFLFKKPYLFKSVIKTKDITWDLVNEVYTRADCSSDGFKLMKGEEVPKNEYIEVHLNVGIPEARIIREKLYKHLRDGATLVYNRIKNEPIFDQIAKEISTFTRSQVITSGYLAFGKRPSYKSHWDTRDVFAVQLMGKKRWVIKEPNFPNPIYTQQNKFLKDIKEPNEVYMDVTIEQGDVLYVPRGWWHNPIPTGENTFHLAVGTFPPTVYDYFRWIIRKSSNLESVREGIVDHYNNLSIASNDFSKIIDSEKNFQEFMDYYIGEQRINSPLCTDTLGNPSFKNFSLDSRIEINAPFFYESSREGSYVILNGVKINSDEEGLKLLRHIEQQGSCRIHELMQKFSPENESLIQDLVLNLAMNDVVQIFPS
ncbi:MAG: cupin domain-containing protein [Lautropia sp.]|nr:cupin domain-containing protein [Lautropia sp.]